MTLDNVSKSYGSVAAVRNLSLACADGEMLALLGPSGCGKTSTLKMIAGIEELSAGEIYFDGRPVGRLSPGERNIAMVFEDYALYPSLSVFENVAFPLKVRKRPPAEVRKRVEPTLELLGLQGSRDTNVRRLSGGAQQRVAIGRALVREPELIIFDEPLSHLDGDQKVGLRAEIKRLQKQTGLTAILVTHDQTEAVAMADRVAVMNLGELQQVGPPQALYDHPANLFVADFIGEPPMNLLPATLHRTGGQARLAGTGWSLALDAALAIRAGEAGRREGLILGVRPEHVRVSADRGAGAGGIAASVAWREHRGDVDVLGVALSAAQTEVLVETHGVSRLAPGARVDLEFPRAALSLFDAASGRNVLDGAGAT